MKPKFSVLIPVYNREEYVRQAIDSVLAQTCQDFELIVVDDGSTDRTPSVLRSYGSRLRTARQGNQGPEAARVKAAELACGKYLVFLDSDDLLLPTALATYDRIIHAFNAPPLIIGRMIWFKGNQPPELDARLPNVIEVQRHRDYLGKNVTVSISYSVMVILKDVFQRVGGPTSGRFPADDYDLMLKMGVFSPCLTVKLPCTVAYRSHQSNGHKELERMVRAIVSVVQAEHRGEYPGGLKRCLGRYALIGGPAWQWVKISLEHRRPDLACKLFVYCGPMIAAGGLVKFFRRLRRGSPVERIPFE
jgi:glycosyltransferase involved in cell wall biosynthesis